MTNIDSSNNGINYDKYNFANENSQIGGNDAKTNKINFSDGLTKNEALRIDKKFGNGDGILTEDEFVEACLEDDTETSGIKSKTKDDLKSIFQKYLSGISGNTPAEGKNDDKAAEAPDSSKSSSYSKVVSSSKVGKDSVEPSIKTNSKTKLPESLSFGKDISITNIKTGSKMGEYYSEMTMGGKTYKRTEVTKNSNNTEFYTLKPEPNDGSKIVIEKRADGSQYYCVYGTNRNAQSKLEVDKNGEATSIFRYEDGLYYEREYFKTGRVRRYDRDENNNLVSSKDYKKKDDGTIDLEKPLSSQTYIDVGDMGKQWASRVIYQYDKDGKQTAKETHKFDYNQEKDENGNYTGKLTILKQVFDGESTDLNDLIAQYIEEFMEGILQAREEIDKDKKSTKVVYNSDGSTTTTITEGEKVTVIEKDDKGEVTSETVTENGETKTIDHTKDKEEDKGDKDDAKNNNPPENVSNKDKSENGDGKEKMITPDDAKKALKSKGYSGNDIEKIVKAIFGDKSESSEQNPQISPENSMMKITELGYTEEEARKIAQIIFGEKK